MAKKKDKDIAEQMMNDIISKRNTVPFRIPNSSFSFGDGYDDDDDDIELGIELEYEDEYYDPENSKINGVELCMQSVRSLGNFLSERDIEKTLDKIEANVNGQLRKLKEIKIGDILYIQDGPDEGEEYLVMLVGMYCDCCGERYRDSRDGRFVDEKAEPTIATLADWTIYGISANGAIMEITFDQVIYKGFEIRDSEYSELGDLINKWIGK